MRQLPSKSRRRNEPRTRKASHESQNANTRQPCTTRKASAATAITRAAETSWQSTVNTLIANSMPGVSAKHAISADTKLKNPNADWIEEGANITIFRHSAHSILIHFNLFN